MGTRSEIHIRDLHTDVELWKHWDGYPEYMMELFREFAKWVYEIVGDQKHWLSYPEDVSAYLIAYYWEIDKRINEEFKRKGYKSAYVKPDIRPRGRINDFEYLYIIEVGDVWTIKCYKSENFELTDEERKLIREHREDEIKGLVKVCEEKIPMNAIKITI
jgi:hypothetical protein